MGPQAMSFVERFIKLCCCLGESTIRGCTVHTSTVHTSTVHTSTVHTSTVHTSTVHTSTVHTSTVHTSTVHTSAVHTSTVHTSAVHTSTVHTSTVHTSTVHTSTVHTSTVRTSTVRTSTVRTSTVHTGTVHTSTVHTSTVRLFMFLYCTSSFLPYTVRKKGTTQNSRFHHAYLYVFMYAIITFILLHIDSNIPDSKMLKDYLGRFTADFLDIDMKFDFIAGQGVAVSSILLKLMNRALADREFVEAFFCDLTKDDSKEPTSETRTCDVLVYSLIKALVDSKSPDYHRQVGSRLLRDCKFPVCIVEPFIFQHRNSLNFTPRV